MIVAITAAEAAFWVFLVAGLAARYVLRRTRASRLLLLCVPLVDVALLCFVAIDIAGGAPPSRGHALAAVYLGVTVAFGHSMIGWADVRFRHRFAGGPRPVKPAKGSRTEVRGLWTEWLRVVLSVAIASALILVMILIDGFAVPTSLDAAAQDPYWGTIVVMVMVTGVWFVAGPATAGRARDRSGAGPEALRPR